MLEGNVMLERGLAFQVGARVMANPDMLCFDLRQCLAHRNIFINCGNSSGVVLCYSNGS